MKTGALIILFFTALTTLAQQDTVRRIQPDTSSLMMNMDAVYNRPFLKVGKTPVAVGGYVEANSEYMGTDGVTDGLSFQMQRLTIFLSSTISRRIKFLAELEFEDGTKEINIEFASVDFEFHPLLNLRGGIVMNPIGAFNQNHDGPKWEFVDRPLSATQLLPATWSNVGVGLHGKHFSPGWVLAYEMYFTNGFDDTIVANEENKTFLPASKANAFRFEESSNGKPLFTGKVAIRNQRWGELGLSYMGGVYNKFQKDGLILDEKRRVDVFTADFNTRLPKLNTSITTEWAWTWVNIPATYTQQFGNRQAGGFVDFVQPIIKKPLFGFEKSVVNLALRFEYVDWNVGSFKETGGNISDDIFALVPAITWRPSAQSVLRFNYRYEWQQDLFGNSPSKTSGFQFGIASYF